MRTTNTFLAACLMTLHGASRPNPDPAKASKSGIWAAEYHIYRAVSGSGNIPLLDPAGKELGPRLSALDFCNAALEGTVVVGTAVYNVSGTSTEAPQADCTVNRDVRRNRFESAQN